MDRWEGKVAFVTGTSAGIGLAIAEKLVESGVKVIGFARRKNRLDELAKKLSSKKGKFYPFPGDVTKEEDILNAFKWAKNNVGPVSILINNAGIAKMIPLCETPTKVLSDVLTINVLGPCIATREAIKQMNENNIDGHIIHINSTAGHSIPSIENLNIYPASKYALTALAGTLRQELANLESKIKVTNLSPGLVRTEIAEDFVKTLTPEQLNEMGKRPILNAEDVADATLYVLSTPKHVQISELTIQPVGEKN